MKKVRGNGGYSRACQSIRIRHTQNKYTDISWMDDLPGGSWKDPGILKAYMQTQYDK